MNLEILEKLENKKNLGNLDVKPIFFNDEKKKLLDNFLSFQKFLNKKDIFSIININFSPLEPVGYSLIDSKKNVVGFLGTIFSKRIVNNKLISHCYLHSWVVDQQHRLQAFRLLIPVIKKNIFISTFSPTHTLEGLYKKLNFEEKNFYNDFMLVSPFNYSKKKIFINEDPNFYENQLDEYNFKVFQDHRKINVHKFIVYFDDNLKNNIFFIVKKKIKKNFLPVLEILYFSDHKKYQENEEIIHSKLAVKFKTLFIIRSYLMRHYAADKKYIFKKTLKKKVFYFNKPDNFNFDLLYSEALM